MTWVVLGILAMLVFTFAVPIVLGAYVAGDLDNRFTMRTRVAAGVAAPVVFALSFLPFAYCFNKADDMHCPPNMVQMHYQTGPKTGIDYCTPVTNQ